MCIFIDLLVLNPPVLLTGLDAVNFKVRMVMKKNISRQTWKIFATCAGRCHRLSIRPGPTVSNMKLQPDTSKQQNL